VELPDVDGLVLHQKRQRPRIGQAYLFHLGKQLIDVRLHAQQLRGLERPGDVDPAIHRRLLVDIPGHIGTQQGIKAEIGKAHRHLSGKVSPQVDGAVPRKVGILEVRACLYLQLTTVSDCLRRQIAGYLSIHREVFYPQ